VELQNDIWLSVENFLIDFPKIRSTIEKSQIDQYFIFEKINI